jgi:2'-5' RNA ligase
MLVSCTIELPEEVKKQIEKETKVLFNAHPEYLWYDIADYHLTFYSWPNVEPDLIEKLSEKLTALLFEQKQLILYGLKYVVKIGNHIDVTLQFQEDRAYRSLVESVVTYFSPELRPTFVPLLPIARYKIPSKQQYSHLKNRLEKIKTEVEIPVSALSLCKVTDFGNGIRKHEELKKINFEL